MLFTLSWLISAIAAALISVACAGVIFVAVQTWSLWRFTCGIAFPTKEHEPISIIKPLCGIDDELEENLISFAMLSYKNYEIVLGVPSIADPAYPLAQRLMTRFPNRFRIVLEEPCGDGANPKVRQLITLAKHAKYDILVVSDSNVRAVPNYLYDIADNLSDASIGCVTHPIVGVGEDNFAALMENMQVISNTAGVAALYVYTGRPVLVGKSIGIRKSVLAEIGGFESYVDFLAEDFLIGVRLAEINKSVCVSTAPVYSITKTRNLNTAFARQLRWATMQWYILTALEYVSTGFLHVIPMAALGAILSPQYWVYAIACAICKIALEYMAMRKVRPASLNLFNITAILLKDFVYFAAWFCGPFFKTVSWRGKNLAISAKSHIKRMQP
jgi:ceramide glucosyltransferase